MLLTSQLAKRYLYIILTTSLLFAFPAHAVKIVPLDGAEFDMEGDLVDNMHRFKKRVLAAG